MLQEATTKLENLKKEFGLRIIADRFCDILKSGKTVDDGTNDIQSEIDLRRIVCLNGWFLAVEYQVRKNEVYITQTVPDLNAKDPYMTPDLCILVMRQDIYDETGVKPQLRDGHIIVMPTIRGLQYDNIKSYAHACSEAYSKVYWISNIDPQWFWRQVGKAEVNFKGK